MHSVFTHGAGQDLEPELLDRRAFFLKSALWLGAAGISPGHLAAAPSPRAHLRIGLLTDSHYADREPNINRYYRHTLGKIRECIDRFDEAGADFVVELGDFIDAADSVEAEIEYLQAIEAEYARFRGPRHYVLGNHCVWTLTKRQFAENSGAHESFHSFDRDDFHFVVLDACFREDGVPYGGKNFHWTDTEIPPAERDWLRADLEQTGKPTIVFVHQRLDVSDRYAVKSAPAVRQILEEAGNVLAVFQGHWHRNDYRGIGGIHYCTLAAMVEGSGQENNAYSLLSVYADGSLRLEGFRQQSDYHWSRP